MKIKKLIWSLIHLIAIVILTVVTQLGGLIYLISILFFRYSSVFKRVLASMLLYFLCTFLIVPFLASLGGRRALPLSGKITPYNFVTCLLNRHYVNTETRNSLEKISEELGQIYKGISIMYLDANFPFIDGFPLLPHLSHSDGKKLDIAFYYLKDGESVKNSPSIIGYGFYDSPLKSETNYPESCSKKGHWQYDLISKFVPLFNQDSYSVDVQRTKSLITLLNKNKNTNKIFIEPHLQQRWKLGSLQKIRFHGCHAVRHDDHIHWQTN